MNEFERLCGLCAELLRRPTYDLFVRQVARVLLRLEGEATVKVLDPLGVIGVFRSKQRIPASVQYLCRWDALLRPSTSPAAIPAGAALTIAFAASAYPRRMSSLSEWECWHRLECLKEVFRAALVPTPMAVVRVLRENDRLPAAFSNDEAIEFLEDLGAVPCGPDPEDQAARLAGAALMLATLSREALEREAGPPESPRGVLRCWRDDAALVRLLRKEFRFLPSSFAGIKPDRNNDPWPAIRDTLEMQYPDAGKPLITKIVDLEKMFWTRRPEFIAKGDYAIYVANWWQELVGNLVSGFPYYGFEAHFFRYWKVCVCNYQNQVIRVVRPGAAPRPPGPASQAPSPPRPLELNPKALRAIREGWRFVRATFSVREAKNSVHEAENPAMDNEALRARLDQLWKYYLQRKIVGEETNETASKIAAAAGMNVNTAYTLVHRIGRRMIAYDHARIRGFTNAQIVAELFKRSPDQRGAASDEPTYMYRAIASLARPIPPEGTLLWAFLANVFLRPKIDFANPDPWTVRRCVEELRFWLSDTQFWSVVRDNALRHERPSEMFMANVTPLFTKLFGSQRSVEWRRMMDEFWKQVEIGTVSPEEWVIIEGWSRALVADVIGQCGYSVYKNLREVFGLKRPAEGDHTEWIVPAWYLIFVERLPVRGVEEIIARLKVDEEDVVHVRAVIERIKEHCGEKGVRL